jgi:hypothetical protein
LRLRPPHRSPPALPHVKHLHADCRLAVFDEMPIRHLIWYVSAPGSAGHCRCTSLGLAWAPPHKCCNQQSYGAAHAGGGGPRAAAPRALAARPPLPPLKRNLEAGPSQRLANAAPPTAWQRIGLTYEPHFKGEPGGGGAGGGGDFSGVSAFSRE